MSSLLKFESSITSEIEAELLLGKSINLEKARYYALTNDIEGVTREIASHIGTAKDFTDMNVIQQNALAKAVGLSREELASSLIEREALNKLGNKDLNLQEAYNRLKKEGLSQDRIAKELGNEALARQYESQSIQTKFNASIEKLKDIFVGLAGPVLKIVSPFVDLASSILPHIVSLFEPILTITKWLGEAINYVVTGFNNILKSSEHINFGFKIMKETLGAIAFIVGAIYLKEKAVLALETIKKAYKATSLGMQKTSLLLSGRELALSGSMLGKALALASANIVASFAASPIKTAIGMAAGVAAVATLASLVGRMSKQDDMVSEGYGKRIISSPEGTIALNDRDTIVAGTDLFRQESTSNKNQIINNQININPLIEEMKQIKTLLGNLLNKESNVYIDGFLVGKSLSLSSVKIG
jgi:transcriptional regulator with XRE-family HTH domain